MFTPSDTDRAAQWIDALIPRWNQASSISEYLLILNSAVLVAASCLLAVSLVAGVAQSAHEGKILGKRWSSLWGPIRPILGFALLLPIGPSGLSSGQLVVVELARAGAGLASHAWAGVVNTVGERAVPLGTPPVNPAARDAITGIFQKEACWAAVHRQFAVMEEIGGVRWQRSAYLTEVPAVRLARDDQVTYTWGPYCGSVTVPLPAADAPGRPIAEALANLIAATAADVRPTARLVALASMPSNSPPTAPASWPLADVERNFVHHMWEAAQAAITTEQAAARADFARQAAAGGFVTAGLWWNTVSTLNAEITAAATLRPAFSPQNPSLLPALGGGAEVRRALDLADEWWRQRVQVPIATADAIRATGGDSVLERLLSPAKWEWVWAAIRLQGESGNAIGELAAFGHGLAATGEAAAATTVAAYAALKVGAAVADAGGEVPFLGPFLKAGAGAPAAAGIAVFEALGPAVGTAMAIIIVGGLWIGNIVPMLPFLFWLMGLMVWFKHIITAVLAATIWALSHVRMDGDGFAGPAMPGYLLVFEIFARPVFMLGGLLLGTALFNVLLVFLGEAYYFAVRGALGGNIGGLPSLAIFIVVYLVTVTATAWACLQLINGIPNAVSGLLQGRVQSAEDTDARVAGVVAVAGGGTQTAVQQSTRGALSRGRAGRTGAGAGEDRPKFTAQDTVP